MRFLAPTYFKPLLFLGILILILSLGCQSVGNIAHAENDQRALDYYTDSWKFDDNTDAHDTWANTENQTPPTDTNTGWEPPPMSDPEPIKGLDNVPPNNQALTFPDADHQTHVLDVTLQYKPDAEHYLNQALNAFKTDTERAPTNAEINAMAIKAFSTATHFRHLTQWGIQGPVHPWVIQPQVVLTNHTDDPWLDVTVTVILDIKWGYLRVDSQLFLTDLAYLRQSAQWTEVRRITYPIVIVPPDDRVTIPLSPIEILPLITPQVANSVSGLSEHWPESIRLRAWLTPAQDGVEPDRHLGVEPDRHLEEQTLELLPDYFMTPFHPLSGIQ